MGGSSDSPPQYEFAMPDPALVAQQQQAAVLQQQAVQQSVSADTSSVLRQFGAMAAMSGAGVTLPFTTKSGGFANPIVTGTGNMKGAPA